MKDVLKELKTEFNAYAETVLAHRISEQTPKLTSVHKVSQAILALIAANQDTLATALETSPHAHTELLSPKMHGHLTLPSHQSFSGKNLLDLVVNTLNHEKNNLAQLMQLHAFFIYRLYDHCPTKNDIRKAALVTQIFKNNLFANRKRDIISAPKENLNPGVTDNPTLAQKLSRLGIHKPTSSPKDQFKLGQSSHFFNQAQKHNLPVASDVSGHTGSLLLGALLYGDLSQTELQEYITAAFSFLTLARAHTFHEVMIVGQTAGLPFSFETYNELLPENLRALSPLSH